MADWNWTAFRYRLRQISRQPWVLPAAYSLLAVVTVFVAFVWARLAWHEPDFSVSADAVSSLLTVLATSMLSVAVFSLSAFVSALGSATQNVTPRAVPLIARDRTAHTSISVFIGTFLYSIVGLIAIYSGIYSAAGRLVLFFVTLLVTLVVVIALIRWIGQVSTIGRVGQTIGSVEKAAAGAMAAVGLQGTLRCRAALRPEAARRALVASRIGYVQHISTTALQRIAEEKHVQIHLAVRPGDLVDRQVPLAFHDGEGGELSDQIRSAFVIGKERTFEEDPVYGLQVLAEIGSRALSTGVNDPGTAIDVLDAVTRVLANAEAQEKDDKPEFQLLTIEPQSADDLLRAGFGAIARDGATIVEVADHALGCLKIIGAASPRLAAAASEQASELSQRALLALTFPPDRDRISTRARSLSLT